MKHHETSLVAQKSAYEHALDPNLSLASTIAEFGFEGLSDEQRLTIVEHASLDDYITAADIVHRKVAPDQNPDFHPEPVKIVDPKTKEVRHVAAGPAERVDVMSHALENAQQIAKNYRENGGDVQDALQRCGNLVAFGILLAHNWEEGNGRTARVFGELVQSGYDSANAEQVNDIAVLSANRPDEGFRINSYVPRGEWADNANADPKAFLDTVAATNIPLDGASYQRATAPLFSTPRT